MSSSRQSSVNRASVNLEDALKFTFADGAVTNLLEYDHGTWKSEHISANESYTYDGKNLIKTETERGRTEVTTYGDLSGNGIFTKVSSAYLQGVPGSGASTTEGGSGDDSLDNDYHGGIGNDHLYGGIGQDSISGDLGNDLLEGGEGNDSLYGGKGVDSLQGDGGSDDLYGGADNDRLYGGSGTDSLCGDLGNDYLAGGAENDVIAGGIGRDTMSGGTGLTGLFSRLSVILGLVPVAET